MSAYLAPVENPKGLMLKMGYRYTKRRFGTVPGPLSVFCARMPTAFTSFYGKVGKLDKKLTLPGHLAPLIRYHVASINGCAFCMDGNRFAALSKAPELGEKLDELPRYRTSAQFSEAEKAALDYVTEVTEERHASPETFAALQRQFGEREICDIVWLVASEHLYNVNNLALNIGSAGMCDVASVA